MDINTLIIEAQAHATNMQAYKDSIATPTTPLVPAWLVNKAINQWLSLPNTQTGQIDMTVITAAGLNPGDWSWGRPDIGILAYSGGTLKKLNSTLILFGGGGSRAWAGNELRGLCLEVDVPHWNLLTNPSPASLCWANNQQPGGPSPTNAYLRDGVTPNARHSFYQPQFIDSLNTMLTLGVCDTWENDSSPAGNEKYHVDAISLDTKIWALPDTHPKASAYPRGQDGNWIIKHPITEKVYFCGQANIGEYTASTKTWKTVFTTTTSELDRAGACIDPVNNVMLRIGQWTGAQNIFHEFNMATSPNWSMTPCTVTGPYAALINEAQLYWSNGFVYDSGLGCFLMYQDDGFLYTIKRTAPAAYIVDRLTMTGTAPTAGQTGGYHAIWGRMQYVPNLKGVVMCLSGLNNVYFVKTS